MGTFGARTRALDSCLNAGSTGRKRRFAVRKRDLKRATVEGVLQSLVSLSYLKRTEFNAKLRAVGASFIRLARFGYGP